MSTEIANAYIALYTKMPGVKGDIEKQLGGPDVMKATENSAKKSGGLFSSTFGKYLGAAAIAAGVVAASAGLYKFISGGIQASNELSGALREVVTLTGETGTAADVSFGEFQSGVRDVSRELGLAQDVLTGGLYSALSAGVPRENAFTFLETAGKAAIAGVTDTETAVDGLTTVINAFQLEASQAGEVSDSLFAAVQGGKTTFEELSASLFNVAPAAAAANVDFKEVNAAIATLTAAGTPTAAATTQIRAALQGLQKPSKELDAIFQALGYQNAQLAIESEGLGFALNAVKDASGGNNGALQKLLGTAEAVAAVNVLAGTGAAKFAEELDRQSNSLGATQKAFDEIDKSRSTERLANTFSLLQERVGAALLPAVTGAADGINNLLLGALDKAGPVLDTLLPSLMQLVSPLIEIWSAASPVSVLFQALQPVLPQLAEFISQLAEVIGILVGTALEALAPILDAVVGLISSLLEAVLPLIQPVLDLVSAFLPLLPPIASLIGMLLPPLIQLIGFLINFAITPLTAVMGFLIPVITGIVEAFANYLIPVIDSVMTILGGFITFLTGVFTGNWEQAWEGVQQIFVGIWDGLKGIAVGTVNFIIDLINGVINGINSLSGLLSDATGGAINLSIPQIPRLAEGAYISARPGGVLANIGEGRYDEVVLPLSPPILDRLAGGGKGAGVTFNNYAPLGQTVSQALGEFSDQARSYQW